ncbi:MAG TPA: M15 family metallopeptidase [Gammaproteobacteria bacterium]|nr:M15 family metallopeptidase [Gammaproteobacteria bacterium]
MKKSWVFAALICPLSPHDLVHVQVPYWGFDHKSHTGILVVNKNIEPQVKQIFEKIYQIKFPIEKIKPLEDYNNNEEKAMEDNDTFGYHCKKMTSNSNRFSKHAYGLAIDINPVLNPYISHTKFLPVNGKIYADRTLNKPGMITKDSPIYTIFSDENWKWGGNWKAFKDYHHFETRAG